VISRPRATFSQSPKQDIARLLDLNNKKLAQIKALEQVLKQNNDKLAYNKGLTKKDYLDIRSNGHLMSPIRNQSPVGLGPSLKRPNNGASSIMSPHTDKGQEKHVKIQEHPINERRPQHAQSASVGDVTFAKQDSNKNYQNNAI